MALFFVACNPNAAAAMTRTAGPWTRFFLRQTSIRDAERRARALDPEEKGRCTTSLSPSQSSAFWSSQAWRSSRSPA